MSYQKHYIKLLARHYTWAFGGLDENVKKNLEFFRQNLKLSTSHSIAIDLGSGSGFQSIALSKLCKKVYAIDTSSKLLAELKLADSNGNIETQNIDIADFTNSHSQVVDLIVCMGDTLTHLPNLSAVDKLITQSYHALRAQGHLVLSFRDLSHELYGPRRVIPVRSDETRIFTCFLEYGESHVLLTDMIYERQAGSWKLFKSCYKKVIIPIGVILNSLKNAGFEIVLNEASFGTNDLIAKKI